MAFPIRYRLRHKETGEIAKKDETLYAITPGGQPVVVNTEHYYISVDYPSTSKFTLEVAIEKIKGKWDYKKVGF